jgi:hypothetical protein
MMWGCCSLVIYLKRPLSDLLKATSQSLLLGQNQTFLSLLKRQRYTALLPAAKEANPYSPSARDRVS